MKTVLGDLHLADLKSIRIWHFGWHCLFSLALIILGGARVSTAAQLRAGFAKIDITPTKPTPMWGYGARHAELSNGVRDPLWARAVVLEAGKDKLAIVGLDLGRSPTEAMLTRIRQVIQEKASVNLILISGSHTHHGPVIELLDEPGKGKDKFDDAVQYAKELEEKLVQVIVNAAADAQPARLGWGAKNIAMNRNRHTKLEPKPTDQELSIVRIDDAQARPIALVVNFAAHATMLPASDLRFSGDWPGQLCNQVESMQGIPCVFMQGAAGDLSPHSANGDRSVEEFGREIANHVIELHKTVETKENRRARIDADEKVFDFETRLAMGNPVTLTLFSQAFFPELAAAS